MLSPHPLVSQRYGMTAHTDVRVMQLNPPSGYTFLGYVAVVGYHSLPRTDAYRYCITYGFNKHAFKMHNAISNNNWFGTPCPTRNTNVSPFNRCVKSNYVTNDKGIGTMILK